MANIATLFRQAWLAGALVFFLGAAAQVISGQITYPFALTNSMSATLNVNLASQTNFNNKLLGLNNADPLIFTRSYYTNMISLTKPIMGRFPAGLWGNFYDWTVDSWRVYDGYTNIYYNTIVTQPNVLFGYTNLAILHSNLNFDTVFIWNICYDSTNKGVARLQDQDARGFNTTWIELGNENFWNNIGVWILGLKFGIEGS